jgi:hypothetical protein
MTQTDHVATLSRREGGEVGKRRAKDGVLFVMKRLMEGPAYPRDLQRDFGFSCGTIRYHLNRLVKYELEKQLKDKRYAFIDYVDGRLWFRIQSAHETCKILKVYDLSTSLWARITWLQRLVYPRLTD